MSATLIPARRRIRPWLIALAAIVVLWSALWCAAAWWVERTAGHAIAEVAARGMLVLCPKRSVRGYPLALRFSCVAPRIRTPDVDAGLGGLHAEASLLHPATLVLDYDQPAGLQLADASRPTKATWTAARVAVWAGLRGLAGIDAHASDLRATLPRGTVAAAEIENRIAADGDGSTVTHHARALSSTLDGSALPAMDTDFTANISVPPRELLSGHGVGPGTTVSGLSIDVRSGALRLQGTGNLSIDADGLVNGTVSIQMAGLEQLPTLLAAAPEKLRNFGMSAAGAMMAVGRPMVLDGAPAHEVVLTIDRGAMRFGFMALGQIPPIGLAPGS